MKNIKKTKTKTKSAFTMAEILVTMVIVGVVMSILVRTVSRVDPDKNKLLFVKSYQAVEEIIANSINDGAKYDQNIYNKDEIEAMKKDNTVALHFNLSHDPLPDVVVNYMNDGKRVTVDSNTIKKKNAICYYLAEYMNTLGSVNCSAEDSTTMNLRSSSGVCYYGWANAVGLTTAAGYFDAIIDPTCSRSANNQAGYAVRIYPSGAMEVPETSDLKNSSQGVKEEQGRALRWLKNPTTHDNS